MKSKILGLLAAGLLGGPTMANAVTVFTDNFAGVSSSLNTAPAGWQVVIGTGSVDTIANGGFGLTCRGATGGCVDLDGSTSNAGNLRTTATFGFSSGVGYSLTAYLSGNQRGAAPDSLTFGISDGSSNLCSTAVSGVAASAPFAQYTCFFTAASNFSGFIFFDHAGGDNIGMILDDVRLESRENGTSVPEPGTLALLGLGLAGLGFSRRRKA
jgi:hypothetical protein